MHGHMIENRYMVGISASVIRRVIVAAGCTEFAGSGLQFAAQNAYMPRSVQSQRHPVAGNPANLQNNVVSHVNPFTDFSTKHQHFKTPCLE